MKKIVGVVMFGLLSLLGFTKTTTITIIATTDTHGHITSYDYVKEKNVEFGLPYAAYLLKTLRKEHRNVILVDCGDTISGTAITYYHAYYKKDEENPVIKLMNQLHYDVAVLGNHDFDFGVDYLVNCINMSHFPWLSANVLKGKEPLTYGYKIVEKDGVKVGFFGLTTPATYYFEPPGNISGLVFEKMVQGAKKAVYALKEQGADVVVALVHSGKGEMYAGEEPFENALYYVLEHVSGIDVAIYGHTHKENPVEMYNNVLICQPKNYYQSLGVVMIDLQKRDGKWEILNRVSTVVHTNGKKDKNIDRAIKYITSDLSDFLDEKIGKYKNSIEFKEDYNNPGSGFDLLYSVEKYAFNNADCYFLTLPYSEVIKEKGDVLRVRHVFKLLPYDNYLVKCRIKGENLLKILENGADLFDNSGRLKEGVKPFYCDIARNVDYNVDFSKPEGKRVNILKVNGKAFKKDAYYTAVLTTYRYAENHTFFEKSGKMYSQDSFRTLALNYLKEKYSSKDKKKRGLFNW